MSRYVTSAGAVAGAFLCLTVGAAAQDAEKPEAEAGYPPSLFAELEYRSVGPSRGGRVTAVTGHAELPATFYMGATGGGVWKTTDYGRTWRNVSDRYFGTGSIGAVDMADSNPDIVYVGTGSDGIRSNVIVGDGVYRSSDAGATWRHVGLPDAGQIGAVVIHPRDPDVAYVAAIGNPFGRNPERGVYRTRDGGVSWERVLFISDSTGAVDIELAPDDPATVYAAMWRVERRPWTIISGAREGGVYRSTDGGDSWTRLGAGLPDELVGKADLAVSSADPDRLYVLIEAEPGGGLYRSDDRGGSFHLASDRDDLLDRPFYYTNVDADPTDADVIYVNSTRFWKSTDGGESWERLDTPHGDNHDMWINPKDPDIFIQSNDGGANVTLDGGRTWSTQHNQPTAELYQVDVDNAFPYRLYAGQQDNTTISVPSLPPRRPPAGHTSLWEATGGCETGPAVPRPDDPDVVYANCKGRFGVYSRRTGQEQQYWVGAEYMYGHNPADLILRFQRVSPIEVSPHDPDVIYHGSQYVHRTTDEGLHWETISPDLTAFESDKQVFSGQPITRDITGEEFYSTLYSLRVSPHDPNVIWAGANDGPVHVTRDGGATWTDVTPADLPPGGRVDAIEPSPHRPGAAYIAVLRYQFDDWEPYIYRTSDYGASWTRLTSGTNGIPGDQPTRVVREDPEREGLLFAGTEFGIYVSFDDGAHWQGLQQNLPITSVTDIRVHDDDLVLSTMGRGFWIMDDIGALREWSGALADARLYLFQPADAYRMRYGTRDGDPAEPTYRPVGAFIDYYLAEEAGEVRLEIHGADGAIVRRYSSREEAAEEVHEPDREEMSEASEEDDRDPERLRRSPGLHRFLWDLRHPDPWTAERSRSRDRGPMVAPGRYQARLVVDGDTASRAFEVLMDPRVEASGVTRSDLVAQERLNLRIRDALGGARRAAARIEELGEALEERGESVEAESAVGAETRALLDDVMAVHQALVSNRDIAYPETMLIDQLEYLYDMTTAADQRPGADALQRIEVLETQLRETRARLGQLTDARLRTLNQRFQAAGLSPITMPEE